MSAPGSVLIPPPPMFDRVDHNYSPTNSTFTSASSMERKELPSFGTQTVGEDGLMYYHGDSSVLPVEALLRTTAGILLCAAEEGPDEPCAQAMIQGSGKDVVGEPRVVSYADVAYDVVNVAAALRQYGVTRGTRAALVSRPSLSSMISFFACGALSAVLAPIPDQFPTSQAQLKRVADDIGGGHPSLPLLVEQFLGDDDTPAFSPQDIVSAVSAASVTCIFLSPQAADELDVQGFGTASLAVIHDLDPWFRLLTDDLGRLRGVSAWLAAKEDRQVVRLTDLIAKGADLLEQDAYLTAPAADDGHVLTSPTLSDDDALSDIESPLVHQLHVESPVVSQIRRSPLAIYISALLSSAADPADLAILLPDFCHTQAASPSPLAPRMIALRHSHVTAAGFGALSMFPEGSLPFRPIAIFEPSSTFNTGSTGCESRLEDSYKPVAKRRRKTTIVDTVRGVLGLKRRDNSEQAIVYWNVSLSSAYGIQLLLGSVASRSLVALPTPFSSASLVLDLNVHGPHILALSTAAAGGLAARLIGFNPRAPGLVENVYSFEARAASSADDLSGVGLECMDAAVGGSLKAIVVDAPGGLNVSTAHGLMGATRCPIVTVWGCAEVAGAALASRFGFASDQTLGAAGQPLAHVAVTLTSLSPETNPFAAGFGVPGELSIFGPSVCGGYWGEANTTNQRFAPCSSNEESLFADEEGIQRFFTRQIAVRTGMGDFSIIHSLPQATPTNSAGLPVRLGLVSSVYSKMEGFRNLVVVAHSRLGCPVLLVDLKRSVVTAAGGGEKSVGASSVASYVAELLHNHNISTEAQVLRPHEVPRAILVSPGRWPACLDGVGAYTAFSSALQGIMSDVDDACAQDDTPLSRMRNVLKPLKKMMETPITPSSPVYVSDLGHSSFTHPRTVRKTKSFDGEYGFDMKKQSAEVIVMRLVGRTEWRVAVAAERARAAASCAET